MNGELLFIYTSEIPSQVLGTLSITKYQNLEVFPNISKVMVNTLIFLVQYIKLNK